LLWEGRGFGLFDLRGLIGRGGGMAEDKEDDRKDENSGRGKAGVPAPTQRLQGRWNCVADALAFICG
jgi:hypothetical protein